MAYGQPETVETFEAVEIDEQVVQKITSGSRKLLKHSENVEVVEISKTAGMYTLFCLTPESSPRPKYPTKRSSLGIQTCQNTQANDLPLGYKHAKIPKQTILPWNSNMPKHPSK